MSHALFIENARIVGVDEASHAAPTSLRIQNGFVTEVGVELSPRGDEELVRADGRWIIPGLWDQHVHMGQWVQMSTRLDLAKTCSATEVLSVVAEHARAMDAQGEGPNDGVIIGQGYRVSGWSERAEPGALDAIADGRAVLLISGDGHTGWLSSKALQRFGLAGPDRLIDENAWFELYSRLGELAPASSTLTDQYRAQIRAAHARGIVGITDFEYYSSINRWPELVEANVGSLRVRAAFYPEYLNDVVSQGLKTGDALAPLVTVGPLKIIADGSLSSMTAHCCDPYGAPAAMTRGTANYSPPELEGLLSLATEAGLDVAVHAIGDAAATHALDAFERTGARGSIEHAQLMATRDIERMASLNITASVQPAHLLDDRSVIDRVWADRAERVFAFRTMREAGVTLALGSDAPVAPLDPWLAIDAAVYRAEPGDDAWMPNETLTQAEALFVSTNSEGPVRVGSLADLVLLEDNPLETRPRHVLVSQTLVNGEVVFGGEG